MSKLLPCWIACLALSIASLSGAEKPVWVVSNGFHTSLGVRTADFPLAGQMEGTRGSDELLIGWGAHDFYQGVANPWTLLEAILPNRSVLHVVPVRGPIARRFAHSDVFRLRLTSVQFEALRRQLEAAFARDPRGRLVPTGHPGYYPDSHFYPGHDLTYFPKMCNFWVAARLRQSGLSLRPAEAITAADLMFQAQRLGTREASLARPHDYF
jgi:hypothetical protein